MNKNIIWGLLGVFLVACGSDHAGTSTETTNGVAGIVTLRDEPFAAAKVSLVYPDGKPSSFATTTDSQGHFTLTADTGNYNLWIETPDSAFMGWRYGVRTGRDTALSVGIDAPGAWSVESLLPGEHLCLLGTPFCTAVSDQGDAFFAALPAGSFTLLRDAIPSASATIVPRDTVHTTDPSRTFLLEDFEDGDARHLLTPWSGGDGWFLSVHGRTRLVFPRDSIPFSDALTTTNAWNGGRSFLVRYDDPDKKPGVVSMQVGLRLGQKSLNLTELDSIRFWARGTGMLRIALEQEISAGKFRKSIWDISLYPDWREISLTTAFPQGGDDYMYHVPFREVADKIHLLTFFLSEGDEFALDQIRLTGVRPEEFYHW